MAIWSDYLLPIIVGVALLGFFSFTLFVIYWIGGKLGIYRFFKIRKLKKKFKQGFEFDDETVELVNDLIERKWKFKDIDLFTKGSPEREKMLYTYYLLKKLKKKRL